MVKCGLMAAWATCVVIFVLSIVSIAITQMVMKYEVRQQVLLKPGSKLFKQWMKPDVPVYMQIWVLNVTNPNEVLKGEKPVVHEVGPFTYKEVPEKVDVTENKNATLSYRQTKTYFFDRSLSCCSENTNFTTVNVPLVTLINIFKYSNKYISFILSKIFTLIPDEHLFITKTVKQLVWGYEDHVLKICHRFLPSMFKDTKAGIFLGKNGTDDGLYTIHTGEKDLRELGIIDKYNGAAHTDYWTTPYANMINGTDGTLCAPFVVDKDYHFNIFNTDLCRSIFLEYFSTYKDDGVKLYRMRPAANELANATVEPDNIGFCTPQTNCMGSGVLNISKCHAMDGVEVPIIISFPHFLLAAPKYQNAIEGLKPDAEQHSVNMDLEPMTGIVFHVDKRLQINIYVENTGKFDEMGKIKSAVIPVLWVNETFRLTRDMDSELRNRLFIPILAISIVEYILVAISGVLIVVLGYFALQAGRFGFGSVTGKSRPLSEATMEARRTDDDSVNERTRLVQNT